MSDAIRVLHVDDESEFVDLTATFLQQENSLIDVDAAFDSREALDLLSENFSVDCVVSDYDMPGSNGIEFLKTVRQDHPDLPFILFTGKGSEEVASDAISAGATDYLQKDSGREQYELLANRIRNAVEQYRATEQAKEFGRIRTLVSNINQALVRAESKEAAESRVCEIISESDPYLFAWIGHVDTDTNRLISRTSAGIADGYLDKITVTTDETRTGRGPGGTALRERQVAVSQNVAEDPEFETWRDEALEYGFQAVAAVPLEHQETLYGVLSVYASRPYAFDADEQALLAELGDDIGYVLHSFDIRESLRAERDRRHALFENAPSPVVDREVSPEENYNPIAAANSAFEEVFGYDATEIAGEDIADVLVPPDDLERHVSFREKALEGDTVVAEVSRDTTDGLRNFLLHTIPYGYDVGDADGWYVWYTDISSRREREQAIEDLHSTVQTLIEAETESQAADIAIDAVREVLGMSSNGVFLYDETTDCLRPESWTEESEALVGEIPVFEAGEGLAWEVFDSGDAQIHDDLSRVPGRFDEDTPVRSEIILPIGDHGVLLIGSDETDAFDDTDFKLAQTLTTHLTTVLDRIERKAELERRNEMFESIMEASIDGILVVDEDREHVAWNSQFIDMWGVPDEVIQDNPEEVAIEWAFDQLADPDSFTEVVEHLYANPHKESRDLVRLEDGRIFDRYSGPVETDDGKYFGRVWFFRDVTAKHERERELERQNERLEQFTSAVSHDLRNPLSVAQGRLELAQEECESEHIDGAIGAVDRSLTLIGDLLALSREGEAVGDQETVDLVEVCEACWLNVETADSRLIVETDRSILADSSRLKQLLENLMRNAVEHAGPAVTVTISELDDGFYVADDGTGISAPDVEDVFEGGYSTADGGTGFGLSIVKEIAEAHGWKIGVSASSDGGARFDVTGVEFSSET